MRGAEVLTHPNAEVATCVADNVLLQRLFIYDLTERWGKYRNVEIRTNPKLYAYLFVLSATHSAWILGGVGAHNGQTLRERAPRQDADHLVFVGACARENWGMLKNILKKQNKTKQKPPKTKRRTFFSLFRFFFLFFFFLISTFQFPLFCTCFSLFAPK